MIMRYGILLFVILTSFMACDPIPVYNTEIIEFTATIDYYVGTDIYVENEEIQPDREIEAYYRDAASSYWSMVIDVDILIGDGEMIIQDYTGASPVWIYKDKIIRIIVSWIDEGQQGN